MQRKTFSLVSSLLVLGLILTLQTASKAYLVPGWVYGYGGFMQNGSYMSIAANVGDYGTYLTGGVSFTDATSLVKSSPTTISYTMNGASCIGVTLSGPGTFTTVSGTTKVIVSGQMKITIWRGTVNGVTGAWVQAQLWSTGAVPSLLWATGTTWPSAAGSPVELAGLIIDLPVR